MTTSNTNRTAASRARAAAQNGDAESAKASMTDQLAEEADPPKLPDDAPSMTPYLKLPYRKRGEFMERMAKVQELAPKQKSAKSTARKAAEGNIDLAEVSGYYYLLAELDELLHLVAADGDALDTWQAKHTDGEFVELYNVYMRWSQAGEASSSAS